MAANFRYFDVPRPDAYLRANVPEYSGALEAERLSGGQSNPTFLLKLDGRKRCVLRKKPEGALLPSAHAVDREHRVMAALAGTEVPVPGMILLCDDPDVIGTCSSSWNSPAAARSGTRRCRA